MSKLVAKFQIGRAFYSAEIPSVFEAQTGFWINADGQFVRESDGKVWVPPSAMVAVYKEEDEPIRPANDGD